MMRAFVLSVKDLQRVVLTAGPGLLIGAPNPHPIVVQSITIRRVQNVTNFQPAVAVELTWGLFARPLWAVQMVQYYQLAIYALQHLL
jgi:hypothetical protein